MENLPEIGRAIGDYLHAENVRIIDIANKIGVSQTTIVYWRSGQSKEIKRKHWQKLKEIIKNHLPDYLQSNDFDFPQNQLVNKNDISEKFDNIEKEILTLGAEKDNSPKMILEVLQIIKKHRP